jgi:predicted transcriptional regulator
MNRISVIMDRVAFTGFIQYLNKRGRTIDEIAGDTGLEVARIREMLESTGIPLEKLYEQVTEDTIRAAMTDYSTGVKPLDIINRYGFSIHEFRDICAIRNLDNYEELDPSGKLFRQRRAWALRKGGKKYSEIQEELGLNSKQAVGSLITGYENHIAKVRARIAAKTLDGAYAMGVLEKIDEYLDLDADSAIRHIRDLLGKGE